MQPCIQFRNSKKFSDLLERIGEVLPPKGPKQGRITYSRIHQTALEFFRKRKLCWCHQRPNRCHEGLHRSAWNQILVIRRNKPTRSKNLQRDEKIWRTQENHRKSLKRRWFGGRRSGTIRWRKQRGRLPICGSGWPYGYPVQNSPRAHLRHSRLTLQ